MNVGPFMGEHGAQPYRGMMMMPYGADSGSSSGNILGSWFGAGTAAPLNPFLNLHLTESETGYHMECHMPKVDKKDITVELNDDKSSLILTGRQSSELKSETAEGTRCTSQYGRFMRQLDLPRHVKVDDIDVKFKNGLLCVDIPKQDEDHPSIKKIAIN
jgi:HSP20 family molecular chaperone IbpA